MPGRLGAVDLLGRLDSRFRQVEDPAVVPLSLDLLGLGGREVGPGLADFLGPTARLEPSHHLPLGVEIGLGGGGLGAKPGGVERGQRLPLGHVVTLDDEQLGDPLADEEGQLDLAQVHVSVQDEFVAGRNAAGPCPRDQPARDDAEKHHREQEPAQPSFHRRLLAFRQGTVPIFAARRTSFHQPASSPRKRDCPPRGDRKPSPAVALPSARRLFPADDLRRHPHPVDNGVLDVEPRRFNGPAHDDHDDTIPGLRGEWERLGVGEDGASTITTLAQSNHEEAVSKGATCAMNTATA